MTLITPNGAYSATNAKGLALSELNNHGDAFKNLLLLLASGCHTPFASIIVYDMQGDSICFTTSIDDNQLKSDANFNNLLNDSFGNNDLAGLEKDGILFMCKEELKLKPPLKHVNIILLDKQEIVLTASQEKCRRIVREQIQQLIEKISVEIPNPVSNSKEIFFSQNQDTQRINELSDYKHALDESSIVAITNEAGIIKYVNDNFCRISKYSRQELIGQDHRIINSGYHSKEFIKNIWTTITKGSIWKGDIKNRAKDGSFYWVDTTIIPFVDENGKPFQYLAIRSDITLAKIAEEKIKDLSQTLASNDYRFSALIENSNDIISLLDQNYNTIFQSASATRITGWTLEDLSNISRLDHVHPNDKLQVQKVLAEMLEKPGIAQPVRYRKLHKDGHYIWLEGTMTNVLNNHILNGIVVNLRDVTERIESEALVLEQTKQINDILERIQDGFITLDTNYHYTYANRRIIEMTGVDTDHLIGKNVWEVFPEAVGSETQKAFIRAFETQCYISNIDYFPQLELWQENHIYPSPEGLAVFIKDITHQKQSEEKLKQIGDRLSFHITNSPLASMEFDNRFVLTKWSPQAQIMFGWTSDEVIGKGLGELNIIYEPEKERIAPIIEQLLDGTLDRYHITNRNLRKDGTLIYCEWYVSVLKDAYGKPLSMMSLAQDVTERAKTEEALKKSEEKFRALIEDAVDGILVYDPLLNHFTGANKCMAELLGKSMVDLLEMPASELFSDAETKFETLEKRLLTSKESQKLEKHILRQNGENVDIEISVKQMPDNNYLAFARDITERKKQESAIRQLNENLENMVAERTLQLEMANKDLEAFSYSVSHDLRAPLRAVNGYASILEEDYCNKLDAEGNRLLKEVRENAKKMGVLIDDLLTFSRLGRKAVNATLINMNGLCVTAFDEVQEPMKSKVAFVLHPLQEAMADYSLIKQVMINLLSNAVKYSSKNQSPLVEVSSTIKNDEIIFAVKDNGVGFDMKYVNKLFGVFQRLHSTDEFEGTGVGLATVQRVVKKHGGNVWAQGKEGHGATFYFSLPVY